MMKKTVLHRLAFAALMIFACLCVATVSDAAVKMVNRVYFMGLASDTKPTGMSGGEQFYETDTGRSWIYNGSTWVLATQPRKVASPDTTTAAGASTVQAMGGFYSFTLIYDVAHVDTDMEVYVEGKVGSSGWANLFATSDSATTNGTKIKNYTGYLDSTRAVVSAGTGDTTVQVIWHWLFGGD